MNPMIHEDEESLMEITLPEIVERFINLHVTFGRMNGRCN